MRLRIFALIFLVSVAVAHATPTTSYNVTGSLSDGGAFTGTYTVGHFMYGSSITAFDITTTGPFDNASFKSTAPGSVFQSNLIDFGSPRTLYAQVNLTGTNFYFYLVLKNGSFSICSTSSGCSDNSKLQNSLQYGEPVTSAVDTQITPEPSSLLLLTTGLLSAAGAGRRRFLRA